MQLKKYIQDVSIKTGLNPQVSKTANKVTNPSLRTVCVKRLLFNLKMLNSLVGRPVLINKNVILEVQLLFFFSCVVKKQPAMLSDFGLLTAQEQTY